MLVDLLAVVRQAMQVGKESYSLKKLERHYAFERREHTVRDGGASIVAHVVQRRESSGVLRVGVPVGWASDERVSRTGHMARPVLPVGYVVVVAGRERDLIGWWRRRSAGGDPDGQF